MAGPEGAGAQFEELDGSGLRIGIVAARWNDDIVERLVDGAHRGLDRLDVRAEDRTLAWVPGSFELPLGAKAMAERPGVDAVIALGAVIRGETVHFELVANEAARGIQDAQLATGVPIAFGVLATEDRAQAEARSGGPGSHNVGEQCAAVAVEMARLLNRLA